MRIIFTFIFLALFTHFCSGQNLVSNPSFESANRRPAAMLDDGIEFTRAVPSWVSPNRASSDFITSRFRSTKVLTIPPHTGENMIGVVIQGGHWAEYISTELKEPLEVGKKYYVEFWISAPPFYNKNPTGTPLFNDHFGILFDKKLYFTDTKIIEKKPQVVAQPGQRLEPKIWKKINTSFVASEAHTHIYIGQFLNPTNPDNIIQGYFFIDDIFVEKLEKEAEQFEPSKTYKIKGKVASIVMDNIYFETDKYDLLPESFQELNKLVNIMQRNATMTINIKGHTDDEGNVEHNQKLSENRANSVYNYLVQQGIKENRLSHEGHGLSQPIAENNTSEGRQKNRRVEFVTKSQDTLGQGVIMTDIAYDFSKNIQNSAIQLSNIGKDERHWNCANFPVQEDEVTPEYKKILETFSQYKATAADKFILTKTQNAKIVHLQTSQFYPEQQMFILSILEKLKDQGFNYIGLENLKKIEALDQLGYPTLENGRPFQHPIYGELIRQGKLLGFQFFNLTPTSTETNKALSILKKQRFNFQNQPPKPGAQNWAKAMNINRILKRDPNAKVLLLSNNVDEQKNGKPSTIGYWLKKLGGNDILSIGQSTTYQPCAKTQTPLSKKIKINRPSVILKRNNILLPLEYDGQNKVIPPHDIHVYHPKNSFPNNRPTYLQNGNRKPYQLNIDKFNMSYPCLIFAYKKGEDVNKAIPIDVIELSGNQDDTPLILASGDYEVVLRDGKKRKKMEVQVP